MNFQPDDSDGATPPQRRSLVRLAILFYGALLGVTMLWSALSGFPLGFAGPEAADRGVAPLRDASVGLVAGLVVIFVSREFTRRSRWGEELARALAAVLGRLSWPECLALAALSGVAEEAFFRGALQPRLGLVAASLIFGLAHFVPRRELLPWAAFSIAAGFLLGFLFDATGNLLAPVITHALVNAVNLRHLAVHYAPAT